MQDSSWADRLELVGDDDRLVGSAGALPVRLLAERTGLRAGLRAGLSAAMTRRGFIPVYDRGQLLVDLAVTQLLGGEAISDFQGLRHVAPVIGPIPSNPTVWRALAEVGQLQLARINTAVTVFRRHWWGLLAARPEGFGVAEGGRAGIDRDYRGGPGRLDRVRRVGEGERRSHLQGRHRDLRRTWPAATTPTTCWQSTLDQATPPPTTLRTTPLCLTRRWPASRAATGAGC